jgi:hypothetical protein
VDVLADPNWVNLVSLFGDDFVFFVVDVFHSFTVYYFLVCVQSENYEEVETDHGSFNHLDSWPQFQHL